VPFSQKLSLAKQSQVWSGVCVRFLPGQQAPFGQVQSGALQPGQMDFGGSPGGNWPFVELNSQRDHVGSGLGGPDQLPLPPSMSMSSRSCEEDSATGPQTATAHTSARVE
jgi:hypothetical protein